MSYDSRKSVNNKSRHSGKARDLPSQKGKLAEKYIISEKLGRGNFAVVRKVQRKSDGKLYAAKIIKKKNLKERDMRKLHDEVKILQKLSHPNINTLIETFDTKHHLYMVLQLLTGGELFDRIVKKRCYTEEEAAAVIRQVARACEYMHENGVIHRDLKPENIVYVDDKSAHICVTDFGLAKYVKKGLLTKTACGTPGYVAPEILQMQRYNAQVDMWAVGVILYILLCGFPPFVEKNLKALYKLIKSGKFSFPSPYWNNVSKEAKDCIVRLLHVDPQERLSPTALLKHDWISMKCKNNQNLIRDGYDERFKRYVLLNKLRRGVDFILFLNRLVRYWRMLQEEEEKEEKLSL